MLKIDHIDHVAITVSDVERSIKWYQEVLGLERGYQDVWGNCPAMVGTGNTWVALFPCAAVHPDRVSNKKRVITMQHFAFRVDRFNFKWAQDELERRGIAFEFQDHEVCHSIYFLDPDGHEIELTTYEI